MVSSGAGMVVGKCDLRSVGSLQCATAPVADKVHPRVGERTPVPRVEPPVPRSLASGGLLQF